MDGCYVNYDQKEEPLLIKSERRYLKQLHKSYCKIYFQAKFELLIWIVFRSFQNFFNGKNNPYLTTAIRDASCHLKLMKQTNLICNSYNKIELYINDAKSLVLRLKDTSPSYVLCAMMDYTQQH